MFGLMILMLIVAAIAYTVNATVIKNGIAKYQSSKTGSSYDRDLYERYQSTHTNIGYVWKGSIVVAALFFLFSTFVTISAGHVGVITLFGKVNQTPIGEGLHMVNPLAEVHELSVKIEEYTMSSVSNKGAKEGNDAILSLSADGLTMPMDITVLVRIIPDDAPWIYQNIGPDYLDKIIRPASRTATRQSISSFTSQEAYSTRRNEVPAAIEEVFVREIKRLLSTYPNPREGFVVQVLLRNISLPDKLKSAIEEKLSAEQEAEKMEFVLQKESQEAERKRVEAQGIADFQRIVTAGISEPLLRWKGIEATEKLANSPNSKIVVIGGKDGLPLILNQN